MLAAFSAAAGVDEGELGERVGDVGGFIEPVELAVVGLGEDSDGAEALDGASGGAGCRRPARSAAVLALTTGCVGRTSMRSMAVCVCVCLCCSRKCPGI